MIAPAILTDPVRSKPIKPVVTVAIILPEKALAKDLLRESKLSPNLCCRN